MQDYRRRLSQYLHNAPIEFPELIGGLRRAAVLVPIVERPTPTILFTRRSENLPLHAGQVSFPGGRADAGDASLIVTALRETFEETGIAAESVEIAGVLAPYGTVSGYWVLPVVGLVRSDFVLAPNAAEVAEIFEVPLEFLLEPANYHQRNMIRGGVARTYYEIEFAGHVIWGATAGMLLKLCETLKDP